MKPISRRDFLKGSAAAATAALFTGTVPSLAIAQETDAPQTEERSGSYADRVTQTVDTDYVIVGSGMAGLSSAIEAAQQGLDVVLLEQNGFLGGSTNVAEGIFGLNTRFHEEAGTAGVLSVSGLLKQTQEYHHYNINTKAIRRYYEHSTENIHWLADLGVPLEHISMGGMNPTRLAYTGKGAGAIAVMGPKAEELGVHIYLNTAARELILQDGSVCGVYAETENDVLQINAKAVMLATGGYAGNEEMLKKYAKIADGSFCKDCGMPGRNGDGINMALAAGANEWKHMGVLQNFGPILKNDTYASQLYAATAAAGFRFNEQGLRYADESLDVSNFAFSGNIMQQQKASFSIATEAQITEWSEVSAPFGGGIFMVGLVPLPELRQQLEKEMNAEDPQVVFCETLEDVAAAAGVDADTLKQSIARYNELCEKGEDEDFMKDAAYMTPVGEGPYYLFKHKIGIFTTCDGLSVNEYAQVLDADEQPIPGLFAGGMDAGGIMGDAYDVSVAPCTTQGWCLYCGRTAAQYVTENLL